MVPPGALMLVRADSSAIYIRAAIKNNPQRALDALAEADTVGDDGKVFCEFDYQLNHKLAFASGNPIYVLTLNGFKGMYSQIGEYYFSYPEARELARNYYAKLRELAEAGEHDKAVLVVRDYGIQSGKLWSQVRHAMPEKFLDR